MKRFLAFTYDSYYPSGGKGDFAGDFDSLEDAKRLPLNNDYMDVLDTASGDWTEFYGKSRYDEVVKRTTWAPAR